MIDRRGATLEISIFRNGTGIVIAFLIYDRENPVIELHQGIRFGWAYCVYSSL